MSLWTEILVASAAILILCNQYQLWSRRRAIRKQKLQKEFWKRFDRQEKRPFKDMPRGYQ